LEKLSDSVSQTSILGAHVWRCVDDITDPLFTSIQFVVGLTFLQSIDGTGQNTLPWKLPIYQSTPVTTSVSGSLRTAEVPLFDAGTHSKLTEEVALEMLR
jgi:hypothetical protein